MLRRLAIVLACAGISAVASRAVVPVVYQNTASPYYVYNLNAPAAVATLDDGHLASPGADITDFTFGVSVPAFGANSTVDFDALISFYNGAPIGSQFNDVKTPANKLAGYRIPLRGVASGTALSLHAYTVGASFTIPTSDFAVEYLFVTPDGVDINDITDVAAPLLAVGPTAVGSSADRLYEDQNADGVYQSSEEDYFGDGVHQLSVYLRLHGTPKEAVPEPGTLALLGTIAPLAGLVIRRKRA